MREEFIERVLQRRVWLQTGTGPRGDVRLRQRESQNGKCLQENRHSTVTQGCGAFYEERSTVCTLEACQRPGTNSEGDDRKDGSVRILDEAGTFTAKLRNGKGIVCEVATRCRTEDGARAVLAQLERRAELVKAGVMSAVEDQIADHQSELLSLQIANYLQSLRAKDVSAGYLKETKRLINRLVTDCEFKRIGDIELTTMERWLVARKSEGMSARTRNSHLQALSGFCAWAVKNQRMASNPLSRIGKADERSDKRRQRRSLTEPELLRLLEIARWRPLAEFGRESIPVEGSSKRSKWKKAEVTLGNLQAAVERARKILKDKPEFIEELERIGRERALIYKTLVLTGLRKGELASLTVGQLELKGPTPYAILNAADEKNRQGASVPLRSDLAEDLRDWVSDSPRAAILRLRGLTKLWTPVEKCSAFRLVWFGFWIEICRLLELPNVMNGGGPLTFMRCGIHSGRCSAKAAFSPRTAQAAMRHSTINLTMNTYTDPRLLDVHGALDALPTLDLNSKPKSEAQSMRATGTDGRDPAVVSNHTQSSVAPDVAPTSGNPGIWCHFLAFWAVCKTIGLRPLKSSKCRQNPMKKPHSLQKRMRLQRGG